MDTLRRGICSNSSGLRWCSVPEFLLPKLSDSYIEATAKVDSPRAGINPAPTEQVGELK